MSEYLQMRISIDDDGVGELFAKFETGEFRGAGSAWFDLSDLEEQAKQFARYPLLVTEAPCIKGGYWNKDDPKLLDQEHIYISAYPIDLKGNLGLLVRVAVPSGDSEYSGLKFTASMEIKTTYEKLNLFSKDLVALSRGEIAEALLPID